MNKYKIAAALLFIAGIGNAALISRTYTYTDGNTITANENNTNENTIYTEINGNLNNANILDGGLATADYADSSVTTAKIADANVTSAKLAGTITTGSTFTITGLVTVSTIVFSPTTGGIKGTTTNDNASVTFVGEYISSATTSAYPAPASTQWGDLVAIVLTAGDWDISTSGNWTFNPGVTTDVRSGISSTSGNSSTGLAVESGNFSYSGAAGTGTSPISHSLPSYRVSISATTTYYFKFECTRASGAPTLAGIIHARRVR